MVFMNTLYFYVLLLLLFMSSAHTHWFSCLFDIKIIKRDLLILLIVSQNLIFSLELFCLKICNHFVILSSFIETTPNTF